MPGRTRTLRRPADKPVADERDNAPDDQPDEPRRGRSSTRPARRSSPAVQEDEETKPRRGRGRSSKDDEEPQEVRGGWGAWRDNKAKYSNFGEEFKVDYKRRYLILILDDEPFATFGQHWLDDMPPKTRKSYICLGMDCPLCDVLGDEARPLALFNVVEFVETKRGDETIMEPKLKVWQIGSSIAGQLEDLSEDPKTSPLSDHYWQVSKSKQGTGKGGSTVYSISMVKERDLEEDWNLAPLTDDEFEALKAKSFDSTYVKRDTRSDLQEIADDLAE